MRELYALIVGEGGVAPEYFMNVMTGDEAADFVQGFHRRSREMWEAQRIGWFIQCASDKIKSPEELYRFPWDKKPKATNKRAIEALRRKAKAYEAELNKTKENG